MPVHSPQSDYLFYVLVYAISLQVTGFTGQFSFKRDENNEKKRALNRKCGNEMSPGFDFPA